MQEERLISQATINNWKRLKVDNKEISTRLTKRANKTFSTKQFVPAEYFSDNETLKVIEQITATKKNTETVIYNLGLNLLKSNKLIKINNEKIETENEYIREILSEFGQYKIEKELITLELPQNERDILGVIYQSLLTEGTKNKQGSYYTPQKIIDKIIKNLPPDAKFLDPCCGTGSFLISAADIIKNPKNIYGYDLDKTACFIAKINLILKYKNIKFRPNIFNKDFLLDNSKIKADIIATNPPWGAMLNPEYKKAFKDIKSGESFSYFIKKSAEKITNNGRLHFVLPESILNVKRHRDIRAFILGNFHISEIELEGKAFSQVLTDVVTLCLDKNMTNSEIIIKSDRKIYKLNQDFYNKNSKNNFSILDNKDVEILEKIYTHPHLTLKDKSQWGLGIVTGNNSKFISENSKNKEKIYSGKNIKKGQIQESSKHIEFIPKNFQQCAPEAIYRAEEKLVYKFISKKLVFAYDNQKRLFLNSANILIPNIEGYSIKSAMAFLNSTVFQYIYTKKFNELKVLKGNLSELPFPIYDKNKYKNLTDEDIFKIFNLTDEEIKYIKNEIGAK